MPPRALGIGQSSPIHEDIDLDDILSEFRVWLKDHIPPGRWKRIGPILDVIDREGWSLEEVKTLSPDVCSRMAIPCGPLGLIQAEISTFKTSYKVDLLQTMQQSEPRLLNNLIISPKQTGASESANSIANKVVAGRVIRGMLADESEGEYKRAFNDLPGEEDEEE